MTNQQHHVGGVDSHRDTIHVAVITSLGHPVADREFPTTTAGYRRAVVWLIEHGPLAAVGIEGTSSYGVGITTAVTAPLSRSSRSTGPGRPSAASKASPTASTPTALPGRCCPGRPAPTRNGRVWNRYEV